jgi:hypothetical protein
MLSSEIFISFLSWLGGGSDATEEMDHAVDGGSQVGEIIICRLL